MQGWSGLAGGKKRLLKSSKKLFSLSLAEVGLVLGPGRASTTALDYTPLAANASITTGASTGAKSPRSCHGHHPPRRGKTARARPRAGGGSLGHRRAAPPQHSPRRAHGQRARAGSPRTERCREPRAEAPRAPRPSSAPCSPSSIGPPHGPDALALLTRQGENQVCALPGARPVRIRGRGGERASRDRPQDRSVRKARATAVQTAKALSLPLERVRASEKKNQDGG